MSKEIPVFPNFTPISMKRTARRDIDQNAIDSDEAEGELLDFLWDDPEIEHYIFSPKEGGVSRRVMGMQARGVIRFGAHEYFWFQHPNAPRGNYVHINRQPKWDWQKEVLEHQPMLIRTQIFLGEKERRRREHLAVAAALQTTKGPQRFTERLNDVWTHNQWWAGPTALVLTFAGLIIGFLSLR